MKIALLAGKEQKEELLAQHETLPVELIWSTELTSLGDATNADACIDLLYDDTTERLKELQHLQAGVIIINSVLSPLNELTSGCIRLNGWNTFLKRPIVEAAGNSNQEKAEAVFSFLNKKVDWVADLTGLITPRVVASIINEAYFALEEDVSTKEEIDTAMKLGTNYPYGPFEWSEKIGLKNIYALLNRLSGEQKRYEPAALLIKEALI
jgi:3-hydroxybutyryl-CoA dehydrogenase